MRLNKVAPPARPVTYSNTPGETRKAAGCWSLDREPPINATIWLVTAPGKPNRYDAEVYRNGHLIETLTSMSKGSLMWRLKRRYASGGQQ